jgi:hypothetical protein
MRSGRIALALALLGACNAQISDGLGASLASVDAQPGDDGGGSNAPPGGTTPTCANRVLYLNFEGQTLTRSATSDATRNQASWMQIDQGTAPRYLTGKADRATTIQSIVDGVRTELSQFPITVVTDRPGAGDYVMVVLGGKAGAVGSNYGTAVNTLDCGDTVPDDVAWISDGVGPTQHVINLVIGAVGFGIGLTATSDPADCMCGWDNNCQSSNTTACKLGTPINRDQNANQRCTGAGNTQDEVAALHDAFCGK